MYLLTDEALKLLLNRFRNRLATRTNLENKVDKVEGKGLSDNDFTENHESSLNKRLDSISIEHLTGKSNITITSSKKNINLELDTGCDVFFYPVLAEGLVLEDDSTITIPYTFICKEGCDIGQVTVTLDYLTQSELPSVAQTFNISEGSGNIILTNIKKEAMGEVDLSFTLSGDTEDFKKNIGEYKEMLLIPFLSFSSSSPNTLPSNWSSVQKVKRELSVDGTYNITIYDNLNDSSIRVLFENNSDIRKVYYIHDSITNMSRMFNNCVNLVGPSMCGNNVTNMCTTYHNCYDLTGNPVCGDKVTDMSRAYKNCNKLIGNAVCGPNVTNMQGTYINCTSLTGAPICGPNVINMDSTYDFCNGLTGPPACGDKVKEMTYTYKNCYNLAGSPVCGNNVINMTYAYFQCWKITGSPVCGPNVNNFAFAYAACHNLTGNPVCENKVTNMSGTYWNCFNITGSPICGPNVTNMFNAYIKCYNITGSPVCGNLVTNMANAYQNCHNLTGSAVCGPNVINMYSAYQDCHSLEGTPVCGPNVYSMDSAYYNCQNLTGSPVCGDSVVRFSSTYYNCRNLTGSPVCGDKITSMYYSYMNCTNLTGNAVCGPNVTSMDNTYCQCRNLTGAYIGPKVTTANNCFAECYNLTNVDISNGVTKISNAMFKNCLNLMNITIPPSITSIEHNAFNGCSNLILYDFGNHANIPRLNSTTTFSGINNSCLILVPTILYSDWITASNWSTYASHIIPNSTEPSIMSITNDMVTIDINKTKTVDIMIVNFEDINSINVSAVSNKSACVSIGNITKVQKNSMCAIISVELITAELEEDTDITLTVSSAKATIDYTFVAKVEKIVVSYSVEPVDGASYGFELNADGYYESKNKGVNNSYAICKVNIVNPGGTHKVYIDCINYAESNYDYGILSDIGSTLTLNNAADSSGVKKNFKGSSMTTVQSVGYGTAEGTIYIKFRKDSSGQSGNDTLQFKVRFEPYTPGAEPTITVENVPEASYGFTLGSDGYYVNNNVNQNNTAALCRVTINNPDGVDIIFECLQSSEYNYDYGILSKVGSALSVNSYADNSSYVQKSFYGSSSGGIENYGPINGVIYVKYLKDSSASNGTDTFKFKVTYE